MNNRNYAYRSTESEKKGRKLKSHRPEDFCRCLPYLKLHYHDCPVVMKPCPIHGNNWQNNKDSKLNREQNVIISFHPSSKTEKLLQPIKSLLAHCNSETKINFQYYSPESTINKESFKSQSSQNAYENIKRALNSNVLVERTKSFVASKTSKVKKLKQCFHSPCNSIAQKTLSQTSIKAKINQILREEKQARNVFYNMVPEIPPDDKKFDSTTWFYSNKSDFKSHDILPDEKLDSNFITVTQNDKNNTIHHKIFEIKHKKGLNDISFVGFPKQPNSQFVYSTVNLNNDGRLNPQTIQSSPHNHSEYNLRTRNEYPNEKSGTEASRDTEENFELTSSGKTHRSFTSSSSSGSVYITPFIFMPKARGDKAPGVDRAIQVDEQRGLSKDTQTSLPSECPATPPSSPRKSSFVEEPPFNTKATQTESQDIIEKHSFYDPPEAKIDSDHRIPIGKVRDVAIQASTHVYRETIPKTRRNNQIRANEECRGEEIRANDQRRSESNNFRNKEVQTEPDQNDEVEFIELNSPNVTYVIRSFDRQPSDPAIDKLAKTWWGKSHSDSDLYERIKCGCCRSDNENLILQCELNKTSNLSNASGEKSTYTKVFESERITRGVETGSGQAKVVLQTRETIECFSETKQTSTNDDLATAVSDLTELKKIIQDFFEKGNFASKSNCECSQAKQPPKNDQPSIKQKMPPNKDNEVQTSFMSVKEKEKSNVQIQTTGMGPEKRSIYIQTPLNEKNEVEVQTNIGVLPRQMEDDKNSKAKAPNIRQTVTVDENGSTTCFVCALCARDIKVSANAATNTENGNSSPKAKPKLAKREDVAPETTSPNPMLQSGRQDARPRPKSPHPSEVPETRIDNQKRIKSAGVNTMDQRSYPMRVNGTEPTTCPMAVVIAKEPKPEHTDPKPEKSLKPENSPRALPAEKSKIPIPDHNSGSRCTAHITGVVSQRSYYATDWSPKIKTRTCQTQESHIIRTEVRDCICDTSSRLSSDRKDLTRRAKVSKTTKKPNSSGGGKEDTDESRHTPDQRQRSQKKSYATAYPVIITPIWPRDFPKIWKTMESPTKDPPSGDATKFKKTKQKRSYDKDLEVTAAEKKLKMGGEENTQYVANGNVKFSELLNVEDPGNIQGSPSFMFPYRPVTPEEEKSSTGTEEQIPEKSAKELPNSYPDLDEDFLPRSDQYSESNSTTETDNDEEELAEKTIEEAEKPNFELYSGLEPQSQSAVAFNRLLYNNDATTSKSLNAFWVFMNSKGRKIRRSKRQN